jgi:cephalosporin-C deacetylase
MPLVDMPLDELLKYVPARTEPDDFEEFWATTLESARKHDLAAEFTPVDAGLSLVDVYDVSFSGFGGDRIKAWLVLPAGATGPIPCVVQYPGYGGGRGLATDHLLYAAAGYAHLHMDVRGQGSGWSPGDTPDRDAEAPHPHHPGFMTKGVLDPPQYYYRRVVTDAVRAVEAARAHPAVDPNRIVVAGASQGGALTLLVAGLVPDLAGAMPDVPFLCHFPRSLDVAIEGPYLEITRYLKVHRDHVEQVFSTLSYIDGLNFAVRANAPALFSVALLDTVCPPSTVYAAYHHYAGPKAIELYRFNAHEGGEQFHVQPRLKFLRDAFSR